MKILFVVKDLTIEHLGIMTLSSILKKEGHSVFVEKASVSSIDKEMQRQDFSVIAYSVPTLYYPHYLKINKKLKERHKFFSIFGGVHPTFVPDIIKEESIDCVCRGEGEEAILDIIKHIAAGESIRNIANLWVKEDGHLYKNNLRPLIMNLDEIPFPDRELFPHSETYSKGKMHVMTSRGCPFKCSYCSHPAYVKLYGDDARYVRRRSVQNVIAEIKEMKRRTDLSLIMFEDDLFTLSEEWINEFCDVYLREVAIPFFCYVRADCINERLVKKLKDAGCVTMSMGLESGDDSVRNQILKRSMSNEKIIKAAKMIKSAGIQLETMNIVGIPGTRLIDDVKTLKLNMLCKTDYSSVKLLMPYPKTEIHQNSQFNGLLMEKYPTSFWKSSFNLGSKKEKRAIENFRMLFALTVEFPCLLPTVKKIIYLPFGSFYKMINVLWEGYTAYFRLYPTRWKGFVGGVKKYLYTLRFNRT